jgi:hypothetical protein
MSREDILRRALWASIPFNLGGALFFLFPGSFAGRLLGLPAPVPALYTTGLALFVVLFAGTYAWTAMQPTIHRPLVWLAVIGKTSFFVLVTLLWLLGGVPFRTVFATSGDLVLAAIFAWGLWETP